MRQLWIQLQNDERGGVLTTELVLLLSVVSAGIISGLASVRQSVVNEAQDVASVVSSLNQSYGVNGVNGPSARSAGYSYSDQAEDTFIPAMAGVTFDGIIE